MFYDNFIKACNFKGVSPSAALVEAGLNKSAGTRWKSGHEPTDATLQKLADYFGLTKAELLGQKESPPPKGGGLTQEFARIFDQLSPQAQNEIIAEMLKRQRREK